MKKTAEVKTKAAMGYYQSIGRRLINVEETARLLNLSPKTIRNMTGAKAKSAFLSLLKSSAEGSCGTSGMWKPISVRFRKGEPWQRKDRGV